MWRTVLGLAAVILGMHFVALAGAQSPPSQCCKPTTVTPPTNPGGCVKVVFLRTCAIDMNKSPTCQGQFADVVSVTNPPCQPAASGSCTAGLSPFVVKTYKADCSDYANNCPCNLIVINTAYPMLNNCTGNYCLRGSKGLDAWAVAAVAQLCATAQRS